MILIRPSFRHTEPAPEYLWPFPLSSEASVAGDYFSAALKMNCSEVVLDPEQMVAVGGTGASSLCLPAIRHFAIRRRQQRRCDRKGGKKERESLD